MSADTDIVVVLVMPAEGRRAATYSKKKARGGDRKLLGVQFFSSPHFHRRTPISSKPLPEQH